MTNLTASRVASIFKSDELTESVLDVLNEATFIKPGTSVWFTNHDGEDVEAIVTKWDKKSKLYVLNLNGNEVEAESEEVKKK